jgi:hypothetical protein
LGGIVASSITVMIIISALVAMGLDNYKGPGSNALVYGIVGVTFAIFMAGYRGAKNWVLRKRAAP